MKTQLPSVAVFVLLICIPISSAAQQEITSTLPWQEFQTDLNSQNIWEYDLFPFFRNSVNQKRYDATKVTFQLDADHLSSLIEDQLWNGSTTPDVLNAESKKLESLLYEFYDSYNNVIDYYNQVEIDYFLDDLAYKLHYYFRATENDPWLPTSEVFYIYDDLNRKTDKYSLVWDVSQGQMVNMYRTKYEYPSSDLTVIMDYKYVNSEWVPNWKEEVEVDQDGKLISSLQYRYDEAKSAWSILFKFEHDYSENGLLMWENNYLWDFMLDDWKMISFIEYTYDNDKMAEKVYAQYDEGTNSQLNEWKYEYIYNNKGQLSEQTYFTWDAQGSDWVNESRDVFNYHINLSLESIRSQYWNYTNDSWIDENKVQFTLDEAIASEHVIFPVSEELDIYSSPEFFPFLIEESTESSYNMRSNDWDLQKRTVFNYSQITPTNSFLNAIFEVFPNPNAGVLFIEIERNAQLNIFDVNGRHVFTKELMDVHNTIFLDHLENGLYLIEVSDKNSRSTKKIMLQR
jgi:hypothetical protein